MSDKMDIRLIRDIKGHVVWIFVNIYVKSGTLHTTTVNFG